MFYEDLREYEESSRIRNSTPHIPPSPADNPTKPRSHKATVDITKKESEMNGKATQKVCHKSKPKLPPEAYIRSENTNTDLALMHCMDARMELMAENEVINRQIRDLKAKKTLVGRELDRNALYAIGILIEDEYLIDFVRVDWSKVMSYISYYRDEIENYKKIEL